MPRKIIRFLMVILILVSVGAICYPAVSDWWNGRRHDMLAAAYDDKLSEMSETDFSAEWAKARGYNSRITENNIYGDIFSGGAGSLDSTGYNDVLNIAGNGVMGYIEIPKIKITIPIYHGVDDEVLQKGAGHMPGTKLPIGGESNNTVIAAHRGLPSERLFTDIDQLGAGDVIKLSILDETLYYRVEKIWAMVNKHDLETMEEALSIVPGGDHVSLFTCTPYGVNSHRLIVRAERFYPSPGDDILEVSRDQGMLRLVAGENALAVAAGLGAMGFFLSAWCLQGYRIRSKKAERDRKKALRLNLDAGSGKKVPVDPGPSNTIQGGNIHDEDKRG